MEIYSRYTDNKQRLFVLLERRCKPEVETTTKDTYSEYEGIKYLATSKVVITKIELIPITVKILSVHEQTAKELSVKEFEQFIAEGKLIPIPKGK